MDCVVLDGDFVSRKGALTGGYVDTRQSKLAYYRQRAELGEQIAKKEIEQRSVEKEIREVDAQLNTVLNDLQKYETRVKRNRDTYEQMRADMNSRKIEIERFERQRPQKESSIESLRLDVEQLESKRDMLKAELGTELVKQLSAIEQKNVDDLSDRIHKLNSDLKVKRTIPSFVSLFYHKHLNLLMRLRFEFGIINRLLFQGNPKSANSHRVSKTRKRQSAKKQLAKKARRPLARTRGQQVIAAN